MKVGIIGSGEVGQALAKGFLKYGNPVIIGTQTPAKIKDLQAAVGPNVSVGSFSETARAGELIVLAVKGDAAESAIRLAGIDALKGKVVIDATNPIAGEKPVNGVLRFFTTLDESLMERLQKAAPLARFVKAFNSIGSAHMVDPDFGGVKPTLFICGNDADAKKTVGAIAAQFGFEPEDVGMAESARALEPLCILWCLPGFLRNEWDHAFKLLKK